MAAAARLGLDRTVPACPDWTGADLIAHTGRVHRAVTRRVRERETERHSASDIAVPDASGLVAWFEEGAAALLDVPPPSATASLNRLAQAHLLEVDGRSRYRMRDLVRLCAAEHIAEAESGAAGRRVLAALLGTEGRIVDLVADMAELARVVPRLSVLADEEPLVR